MRGVERSGDRWREVEIGSERLRGLREVEKGGERWRWVERACERLRKFERG